ncbi:efflux RND transporter periplasmic adaptor subunit [Pararhizobium sp. BT-229]|uniref:efflux RND transporter periplasmic adaptor subunit n=1 Tax=Pararhizobium sp. BT-229 TaxID=2986923 RepID=UPI0021F78E2C|nr:efflux RND transporter periplasmic adaptor subunit [Pararhizobium sp. BT-229]MCV9964086.1 efflux RND transporter periplasmic adaptor subunit [Pararhizobium sp. BT-229]
MKNSIAAATFAVLLSATALAGCSDGKSSAGAGGHAMPKAQVGVIVIKPSTVPIVSEMTGRTSASMTAEVRPQIGGIVRERLFSEGGEVAQGAPLYRIDPASYETARAGAQAALEKAKAELPAAVAKLERAKGLHEKNVTSGQDLEDAIAAEAKARADVTAAESQVAAADLDLSRTTVAAPISGLVGRSALTEGALVSANQADALTTIRRIDPINVDVGQSSKAFLKLRKAVAEGRVKPEQGAVKVKLKLEDGTVYPHEGTLQFSEADVDLSTGMFQVRASFPNPERTLLPGMFVRAVVEEGVSEGSILVPQRAVSRNVKGEPIALVVKDGKVEERVLSVDGNVGNDWIVTDGIEAGDSLVVEGSMKARAGQEVTAVETSIDPSTGLAVAQAPKGN